MTPPIVIAAPTETDARRLVERLTGCHCWVVGTEQDGWSVQAQPWQNDYTAVRTVLNTVASWVDDIDDGATTVTMDGRTYTLAADACAPA